MVLVGAGPTGAELDSAIAHMVKMTLRSNFRRVEFRQRVGVDGRTPLRQEPELTHGRRCRVPPWRCGCVPS